MRGVYGATHTLICC